MTTTDNYLVPRRNPVGMFAYLTGGMLGTSLLFATTLYALSIVGANQILSVTVAAILALFAIAASISMMKAEYFSSKTTGVYYAVGAFVGAGLLITFFPLVVLVCITIYIVNRHRANLKQATEMLAQQHAQEIVQNIVRENNEAHFELFSNMSDEMESLAQQNKVLRDALIQMIVEKRGLEEEIRRLEKAFSDTSQRRNQFSTGLYGGADGIWERMQSEAGFKQQGKPTSLRR